MIQTCPALLVAAPASGQGKTTVTAALAWHYRQQGLAVRVFKVGPDFLDPQILSIASDAPVETLDLWMVGEQACRAKLYQAASEADLILIEGVMGLYDGTPSAADLAIKFGIPVLAVLDASAMAQTFGAIVHGLASFNPDLPFAGVLANRVGSARHAEMLQETLRPEYHWYGALTRDARITLPERHLGLLQSAECDDLTERLALAAQAIAQVNPPLPPASVFFPAELPAVTPRLNGVRIGVAQDLAFSFCYPANLALLNALGAELVFFSPLNDSELPAVDSVYLPGGYPELHLHALSANTRMLASVRAHIEADKPLVAECGGMLYLAEQLTNLEGVTASLVGALPGHAQMQPSLVALAMQEITLPEGTWRGHTFHYARFTPTVEPATLAQCPNYKRTQEAVYRQGRLYASFVHGYWLSSPALCAALFSKA